MQFSLRLPLAATLCLMALAACSRAPAPPINPRLAIVRLDNQSATTDKWIAPLFSILAQHSLRNAKDLATTMVDDAQGWRSAGAGRFLSGDFRRTGKGIRISARVTDAATSRVLAESEVLAREETDLPAATAKLLGELLAVKPAPIEGEAKDWLAFAHAIAGPDPKALAALDPPAVAYPTLARALLSLGQAEAAKTLASRLPGTASKLTQAELSIVLAASPQQRLEALAALAEFRPADPLLLADLANLAFSLRQWALAVSHFNTLTQLEPQRAEWFNQLAYAHAHLGHLPQAIQALDAYRRLAPQDPNVLDSLGEVHYLNRRFADAARFFDQVPPSFQNGSGLRKAAFAYANAKDLKSADERFERWLQPNASQLAPSSAAFVRALWLARTHRLPEALELLGREAASSTGERQALAQFHAAVFRFADTRQAPSAADLNRWIQAVGASSARNEIALFALMSQSPTNLAQRIEAALPRPEMAPMREQLLAAAAALTAPPPDLSRGVFPLPPEADNVLAAILLKQRPAVLK